MSADPRYEIGFTEAGLASLVKLSPDGQAKVTKVLGDLRAHLSRYPDRIRRNRNNQMVYRHTDPPVEITYDPDATNGRVSCSHVALLAFSQSRPTAFVSYCHKDSKMADELRLYLDSLEELGLLRFWSDREIASGQQWEKEIEDALNSATDAVLFVTQNFLVSDFIKDKELPMVRQRFEAGELVVHWVHVERARYKTCWFASIEALCKPDPPARDLTRAKRKKVWEDIGDKLEAQLLERQRSGARQPGVNR